MAQFDTSQVRKSSSSITDVKVFWIVAGLIVGVFAMASGEADDSPGLQGLGLILILLIFYRLYRRK